MVTRTQLARRIREARESLGLTQAEVAKELGVHRPTISEIEAARRTVNSLELYQFSRLFAVPVAELLREEPLKPSEVERALFRRKGLDNPITRRAVRRFVQRCRTEKELEALLGWEAPGLERPGYQIERPRTNWEAIQQGEWMAERERRRLDLGSEPIRNPLELIQRQGIRTGPLDIDPAEDLDGVFFEADDLGACIGLAPPDPWTGYRSVFTSVHEYAHWLLKDLRLEGYRLHQKAEDELEVRANSFAAAFLMPKVGLRAYFESEGLFDDGRIPELTRGEIVKAMAHFGVSRPALLYRLRNCGLIEPEMADRLLDDHFSVTDVARTLGLELGPHDEAAGAHLRELAVEAWRQGLIGTGRAGELLDLDVETFRDRMGLLGVEQEMQDEAPILGAAAEP